MCFVLLELGILQLVTRRVINLLSWYRNVMCNVIALVFKETMYLQDIKNVRRNLLRPAGMLNALKKKVFSPLIHAQIRKVIRKPSPQNNLGLFLSISASFISAQSCQDESASRSSVENVEVVVDVKAKSSEEGGDALAPPAGFGDLDSPSKKARNNGQGEFCEFSKNL